MTLLAGVAARDVSPKKPVVMSVVFPLSGQSIAQGSQPVKCPDFTGRKWNTTKPKFALDM